MAAWPGSGHALLGKVNAICKLVIGHLPNTLGEAARGGRLLHLKVRASSGLGKIV